MAGVASGSDDIPSPTVQEVCRQFLVHEDAAFAYRLQDQEFAEHFGLNKETRRTISTDLKVAKTEQMTEEEIATQKLIEEQLKLMELEQQDEKVAMELQEAMLKEELAQQKSIEVQDEELARKLFEREQKKYLRHQEKKRQKDLEKKRQKLQLEAELAQIDGTEPFVKVTSADQLNQVLDRVQLPPEPEDIPAPFTNKLLSFEERDKELARRLQEQERKRVDGGKHEEVIVKDFELAKVMQEQEELRARRHDKRGKSVETKRDRSVETGPSLQFNRSKSLQDRALPDIPVDEVPYSQGSGRSSNSSAGGSRQGSSERQDRLKEDRISSGSQDRQNDPAVRPNSKLSSDNLRPSSGSGSMKSTGSRHSTDDADVKKQVQPPSETLSSGQFNIAAAIDPTYRRMVEQAESVPTSAPATPMALAHKYNGCQRLSHASPGMVAKGEDGYDFEADVPPYMPAAGQRRGPGADRRRNPSGGRRAREKEKEKEGCKQQ